MEIIWELKLAFYTVILLVLTTPIHELGHLLMLKLVGSKTKFQVIWLSINGGHIAPVGDTIHLPCCWHKKFELAFFLVSIAGGLLETLVLLAVYFFMPVNTTDAFSFRTPVIFAASLNGVYGILEGFNLKGSFQQVSNTQYKFVSRA